MPVKRIRLNPSEHVECDAWVKIHYFPNCSSVTVNRGCECGRYEKNQFITIPSKYVR